MSGGACKIIICGPPRKAALGMAEKLAGEVLAGRIYVPEDVLWKINFVADELAAQLHAYCDPYIPQQ